MFWSDDIGLKVREVQAEAVEKMMAEAPFPMDALTLEEREMRCSFCDHKRSEHDNGDCFGDPKAEEVNASGDCPCNGFESRQEN